MDWSAHAKKPIGKGVKLEPKLFRLEGGKLTAGAKAQLQVALVLAAGLVESGAAGAGPFNVTVAAQAAYPESLTVSVTQVADA